MASLPTLTEGEPREGRGSLASRAGSKGNRENYSLAGFRVDSRISRTNP